MARDRAKYLEYQKAYQKRYRELNREKLKQTSRDWAQADLDRAHRAIYNSYLKKNFGITVDEYEELLKNQQGLCACCGKKQAENALDGFGKPRRFAVDHDHVTGEIRGLLCHSCNVGIGLLGDAIQGLRKAMEYLEAFEKRRNLVDNSLENHEDHRYP